jgi:6-phosphofructokinase 1
MKKIALVTSGGDAPGMNAAIRSVTRVAYSKGLNVLGFERGWDGLIHNRFKILNPRNVGGILHLGGTILRTSRSPEFRKKEGQLKALKTLIQNEIDGLIVIGGDGSMRGVHELSKLSKICFIGIPATIDNDVYGTEETIGFDSAVNTAVVEIDKIRDTANSHDRIFIVEVMGRKRGFLALTIGLTVGAEVILVPEIDYSLELILNTLKENDAKGKKSGIIVVAEGIGDTKKLAKKIEEKAKVEVRLSVTGYAQRGGNPTARSRFLANLFGNKSIELLENYQRNMMVALINGKIDNIPLNKVIKKEKKLDLNLMKLAQTLAS